MVIDKVHGLQATTMSLNDRFTMLAAAPDYVAPRPRRRPSVNSYNQNQNLNNYVTQIVRRLKMEAKRQAIQQRLGALRRFGSESSLPGLRRSNSFGNLSQSSFKNRGVRRQFNGNLSRAASFENVSQAWRNYRGRGAGGRGRMGGARGLRGRYRGRGRRVAAGARPVRGGRGRGVRARGRGQGGILRNQAQKPVPTKEELDDQLDRYMAGTRSALDKEIDDYMKNAMDLE